MIKYSVKDFRAAGLQAKWVKKNGKPFIVARNPKSKLKHQRETWWCVTRGMFERAQEVGIEQAFDEATLLGDILSVPI